MLAYSRLRDAGTSVFYDLGDGLEAWAVMNFKSVSEVLHEYGCGHPALNALMPNAANYKAMMFQPRGEIGASVNGVFNRNRAFATKQFSKFLALAHQRAASRPCGYPRILDALGRPQECNRDRCAAGARKAVGVGLRKHQIARTQR